MGVFETSAKRATHVKRDELYTIYGKPGTGKTVLTSSFPGTHKQPQCYFDIFEGGTDSIPHERRDNIVVVTITVFNELKQALEDILRGYAVTKDEKKLPLNFGSVALDSVTQLEELIKKALMKEHGQTTMTIPMWVKLKSTFEELFNLLKQIQAEKEIPVVIIAHEKEQRDDENPAFNRLIPSLTTSISANMCAKSSYVWYTDIEKQTTIDPETKKTVEKMLYTTTIDGHPYLNTKCRKPPTVVIPQKMVDLTYDKFKSKVLSLVDKKEEE